MGLHRWTGVPGRNDACHTYVIIATVGLYTTTRTLQTNRTDGINNKLSNAATNKPHGARLDVVGLFARGPIHACKENLCGNKLDELMVLSRQGDTCARTTTTHTHKSHMQRHYLSAETLSSHYTALARDKKHPKGI